MKKTKLFSEDKIGLKVTIRGKFDLYSCPNPYAIQAYIKKGQTIELDVQDDECQVVDEYTFISPKLTAFYNQPVRLYKKNQDPHISITFPILSNVQDSITDNRSTFRSGPVSSETL